MVLSSPFKHCASSPGWFIWWMQTRAPAGGCHHPDQANPLRLSPPLGCYHPHPPSHLLYSARNDTHFTVPQRVELRRHDSNLHRFSHPAPGAPPLDHCSLPVILWYRNLLITVNTSKCSTWYSLSVSLSLSVTTTCLGLLPNSMALGKVQTLHWKNRL